MEKSLMTQSTASHSCATTVRQASLVNSSPLISGKILFFFQPGPARLWPATSLNPSRALCRWWRASLCSASCVWTWRALFCFFKLKQLYSSILICLLAVDLFVVDEDIEYVSCMSQLWAELRMLEPDNLTTVPMQFNIMCCIHIFTFTSQWFVTGGWMG